MPDFHSPEDEATLYVLGELSAAERQAFEARMAQSAELRALVRELEEGVGVLSMGLPQRRTPPQAWTNIEKTLRSGRRGTMLPAMMGWWRNGWAAAAASVVGWLLYAVFVNAHHASPPPAPHETTVVTVAPETGNAVPKPPLPVASNVNAQSLRVRTDEINDLRLKLARLEKETGQLSQLVVQQRAMLTESNRIKFYQLSPASTVSNEDAVAQLSPVLQRAVFMSIGRQLGWLPAESKSRVGLSANGHATVNSIDGVDFVDLRPPKNDVANQPPSQPTPTPSTPVQPTPDQPAAESQPSTEVAGLTIPAFVSGDKLVVALDPSTVAANSSITFATYGSPLGATEGTVVMGNNPMVVTVPYSLGAFYGGGVYLTIGTTSFSGQSNVTQFFVPANP